MEGFIEWIESLATPGSLNFSTAALMSLILWERPRYRRHLLRTFSKCGDDSEAIEALSSAAQILIHHSPEFKTTLGELARDLAHAGVMELSKTFFIKAIQAADFYEARAFIAEIAALADRSESSLWALSILESISKECPDSIYRHVSAVKTVLDNLDRLSLLSVGKYYKVIIQLAQHALVKQGDSSLWNEVQMICRKQVTSLDRNLRMLGVAAILASFDVLFAISTSSPALQDEASCSQPQWRADSKSQAFLDPLMKLFDLALSTQNFDLASANYLCEQLVVRAGKLEKSMIEKVNRRAMKLFEQLFVFEVRDQRLLPLTEPVPNMRLEHGIDEEEALIGICFSGGKGLERGDGALFGFFMPSLFSLVQTTEKIIHDGALDNIDALQGCPILLPLVASAYFYLSFRKIPPTLSQN